MKMSLSFGAECIKDWTDGRNIWENNVFLRISFELSPEPYKLFIEVIIGVCYVKLAFLTSLMAAWNVWYYFPLISLFKK